MCHATPRALLKYVRAVPWHVPPGPFAIFSDIKGFSLQLNYIKLTIAALKRKDISSIGNSIDIQAEVEGGLHVKILFLSKLNNCINKINQVKSQLVEKLLLVHSRPLSISFQ